MRATCLLFLIATLFCVIDSAEASSRHLNDGHHCWYRKYPFPGHHSGLPQLADVLVGDDGTAVYFIAVNLGACFQEWKHPGAFHSTDNYNHRFTCSFPDGEAVLSDKIPQQGPPVFAQSLVTIRCSIPVKYQHLTRKPSLYPGFNVSLYATKDLESENGKPSEAGLPLNVYSDIPVCNPAWPLPNNTVATSQKKYKLSVFTRLVSSYRAKLGNETLSVNPEQVIAWVEYHLRIGFEHVFIYDSNEEEHGPFDDLLRPYIDAGLVTYVWFPFKDCTKNNYDAWEEPGSPWFKNGTVNFVGQYAAGNSVLHRYAHKTEYMAHFDIDEYMVLPPRSDDVKEFLSFYPEYDGIMFEETIFSVCNGTRITKDMLDVKRSQCYKTHPAKCNQDMGTCSQYKSIIKTETVLQFFGHYPTHTKSGEEVKNKLLDKKEGFHLVHFRKHDRFSYDSPNYEGVAITEFTTKSELLKDWDEYLKEKISSHFQKVRSVPAPMKLATRAPSFYYLSSTKGRDSNLGTSVSQAWETWDRLVEHVNKNGLVPGDRVLFLAGDTFQATVPLYLPLDRCHGSKKRPVFIGGHGREATIVAHNTSAIVLYSKNFFTAVDGNIHIAHLNIKGNAEGEHVHGIAVWQENPQPISGIRIDHVKVQNFAGDGIHVERSSRFSGRVKNLVISNCEAMSNLGVPGAKLPTGSGIMVAGADNLLIERCRTGFNGARRDYKDGPVGIWITDCLDSIIRDSVTSAEDLQIVLQCTGIVAIFLFVSYFGCQYCNQQRKRVIRKPDLLRWAAAILMMMGLISIQACGIYSLSGPFEGETADEGRSKSLPPPQIQLKNLVLLSFVLFSASLSAFLWSFVKPRKLRKQEGAARDRKHDRLLFIDGLRGVLALSVVIFHLFQVLIPAFPSERLGGSVVAFFVLSGFVIAYSTQRFQITPKFVLRFIICRAIRLDPPYYVSVLFTFCLAAFENAGGFRYAYWGYGKWKGILVNMLYLQDTNMFGSITTNIVPQSWTLCLEVQFYLFFLISVGTAHFLASKFNSKEAMTEAGQLATGWSVLTVFGSSILVSIIHQYCSSGEKNHFLRHWFHFGMGVLVFSVEKTIDERWLYGFLAMIMLASFVTVDAGGMTTALTVIILHLAVRQRKMKLWLTQRWIQFVGRISYSLYLTHGYSMILGVIMLHNDLAGIVNDPKELEKWISQVDLTRVLPVPLITSVLIAWCIYRLFEYPCIVIVAQLKQVFLVKDDDDDSLKLVSPVSDDDDDSMTRMSVLLEVGKTRRENVIRRHGHLPERVNKTEQMT